MSRLEENNLKKKLVYNGSWLYIFSFLIAPSGYLLKVMISREISVEDIGLFYSIVGVITIISIYNDLGLTEGLQYFLPKYLLQNNIKKAISLIRFTWGSQFITGILISGALYFTAPRLSSHYFNSPLALPLLKIFCIYFLIINLYQVLYSIFYSVQQIKWSQTIDFIRMWSVVIFTASSIFLFDSLTILHFATYRFLGVLFGTITAVYGVIKIFPRLTETSFDEIKSYVSIEEWLSYGWWVMLGQSAGTLYGQINQQFVLLLLGANAAGIWAYYLSFFTLSNIFTGPVISYLFPLFNELNEKGDQSKMKELYRYLVIGLLMFGIIGGVVGYYFAPRVSVLLYGEQFIESGKLFQLFSPWIVTTPLIGILFADIASRGRVKERVYIFLIGLCIGSISSYYLIKQYGLAGSVYGNIIGSLSLLLGSIYVYKKLLIFNK